MNGLFLDWDCFNSGRLLSEEAAQLGRTYSSPARR